MSVKSEVLKALEENRGRSFSGEELAETLGVSRTAVWKAIKSLKEEGYTIQAGSGRGYTMAQENDFLSEPGIKLYLDEKIKENCIYVHKSIDSTNLEAKRLALKGAAHGTAVVADSQTEGRGRLGRSFYSPKDTGIYLTILLKPDFDISKAVLITAAASVAVCRAVKNVCDEDCRIKWVNDVYLGNKKICGILTEAITDFETGGIEYIALGIGVNCSSPEGGFPEDIATSAGAIMSEKPFSRNRLAAEIINNVMDIYGEIEDRTFIEEYKRRSMVLGKDIRVIKHYQASARNTAAADKQGENAVALDIDNDGGLLVEYEDGTREVLNTGEISIRF